MGKSSKPEIKYTKIFINNEWHDSESGETFETLNPATGDVVAVVQEGTKADVNKAVVAARKAFKLGSPWRTMDASKRSELLLKLTELINRDIEHIASMEVVDGGKTYLGAYYDIVYATKSLIYNAGFSDKLTGKTIPTDGDYFAYTRLEPLGVAGIIVPWNAPFLLTCITVGPALATGNTVVLKPAEQTPLSALYLAALVKEAGFPPGVFNVVPGYGSKAGAALTEHLDVDKLHFTGSLAVGRLVQEASAKSNLKRVSLELGGKSPLVISKHCNLDDAVDIALLACYHNSGQTCCAGSRTFVHEDIYDAFIEASVRAARQRKLGDPFAEDTVQGPQIDERQMNRILELIQSGVEQGAKLKCGGKRFGSKGFFVEPTIFADVKDDMRIAREEIFGPVIQIFKYKTLEEVIERANDTEYGLAAGIITKDIDEAIEFSHSVRAGTVWVNNYYGGGVGAPFGGFKQSGFGRNNGEEGLLEYVEVKTVSIKCPQKNS